MRICAGIGRLSHLQVLRVSNNSLATLSPFIGRLQKLAELHVPGNCLSSLEQLSSCTGLMHLDVSRNIITSLQPLANCYLLQVCLCYPTCLWSWSGCTGIHRVHHGVPQSALEFSAQANGTSMQGLFASENRILSIDGIFCQHMSLQQLRLGSNRITSLTQLPWLPQLRSLDLADNLLYCLPPFTKQPALQSLNISFCGLPRRPVAASLTPVTTLTGLQALETAGDAIGGNARRRCAEPDLIMQMLPWLQELDHVHVSSQQKAGAALSCMLMCPAVVQRVRRQLMLGDPCLEYAGRMALDAVGTTAANVDVAPDLAPLIYSLQQAEQIHLAVPNGGHEVLVNSNVDQHTCTLLKLQLQKHKNSLLTRKRECDVLFDQLCSASTGDAVQCMVDLSDSHNGLQHMALDMHASLLSGSPAHQHGMLCVNAAWATRREIMQLRAARSLQRVWRAHRAKVMMGKAEKRAAALLIQACLRGYRVRRSGLLVKLAQEAAARSHIAAVKIQAVWKGFHVRLLMAAARTAAKGSVRVLSVPAEHGDSDEDQLFDDLDFALPELGKELLQEVEALDRDLPPLTHQEQFVAKTANDRAMQPISTQIDKSRPLTLPPLTSSNVPDTAGQNCLTCLSHESSSAASNVIRQLEDTISGRILLSLGPNSALLRKFELQQLRKSSQPQSFGDSTADTVTAASEKDDANIQTICAKPAMKSDESAMCTDLVPSTIRCQQRYVQRCSEANHMQAFQTGARLHSTTSAHVKQMKRLEALKVEWGFTDEATAAAFMQSQHHTMRAHRKQKQRQRMEDPLARLQVRFHKICFFFLGRIPAKFSGVEVLVILKGLHMGCLQLSLQWTLPI